MKEKISWFKEIPLKVFFVGTVIGSFYFYGGNFVLFKLPARLQGYAFLLYLLCSGLSIFEVITWTYKKIAYQTKTIQARKLQIEKIRLIDYHEQQLLREFIFQRRNTIYLPADDLAVKGLIQKGMIHRVSEFRNVTIFSPGGFDPFALDDFFRKNLKFEDLGIPDGTDEEIHNYIINARPDWVTDNHFVNNKYRKLEKRLR